MAEAIAIRCSGVSKSFEFLDKGNFWRVLLPKAWNPAFTALEDVTIDVPKGQVVGVMGRNGAGKSTLLRTVGSIYSPDRGSIAISGRIAGLYELGAAYNRDLTGREYARRLLGLLGVSGRRLEELVRDTEDFSELGARFDDPIFSYSSGMAARLFFAAATAERFDVYLIDEILAVGDQHFQSKCWRRLKERLADGASGLLVTHDWSAALKMCRTIHVLDRGRVVFTGPADVAIRRYLNGEDAQPPTSGQACFRIPAGTRARWRTGEDCRLAVPVEIAAAVPVAMRVSIEYLTIGAGWEIVLLSRDASPVGTAPGRYEVEIAVPRLPLASGQYVFCASLITESPGEPRVIHDAVGWLHGNGVEIDVEDTRCDAAGLSLPAVWEYAPA